MLQFSANDKPLLSANDEPLFSVNDKPQFPSRRHGRIRGPTTQYDGGKNSVRFSGFLYNAGRPHHDKCSNW